MKTEKQIIYRQNQNSLLLTLELNNMPIEYQCRSGYCGICRIKLIKGKIYYPRQQPIASTVNKKEIFPCCCRPQSNLYIKI